MNLKSVMIFDPNDTDEQTNAEWARWWQDNKSAVGDKAVPGVQETQEYLRRYA
ncbi:hypothetical protein GCM10008931_39150 [Oceanobacillus oncorhynchi subsp. oncorhynchi]|uniref:hypothetical protein n=1 Tax=Oceanobacillus oncorhynchi TaxID=545501 RepID=UPI0031E19F90